MGFLEIQDQIALKQFLLREIFSYPLASASIEWRPLAKSILPALAGFLNIVQELWDDYKWDYDLEGWPIFGYALYLSCF